MEDYRKRSELIKERANEFLNQHGIELLLGKYGRIEYFGSYELDLMNRNDVDIALVVDKIDIAIVTDLIKILNPKGFNRFWVFDNTDGGCKSDPKHIVCEAVYGFYNDNIKIEDRWELGIVITTEEILPDVLNGTQNVAVKVSKLSKEEKDTILRLKFELAEKFGVHKYGGTQVYNAVLDGVKSVSEFVAKVGTPS